MKIILLLLASLMAFEAQAQVKGNITGTVTDDKGKALDFASVALLSAKDSSVAKGTLTATDGTFKLESVKQGAYLVRITQVGYQPYTGSRLVIDSLHTTVTLPAISIKQAAVALKEVSISSSRPFIEQKADKMIINVASSVLAAGNTSLELLGKLPGLAVNPDGTVTMKNKIVTIFINGRETYLTGTDLASYLNSLTSEQVDRVELIANPSSKYDAAGSGGIVNIILKKDQRLGLNGTVNASYSQGRYSRYITGLNLNYRYKKINIYGGVNYSDINDFNNFSSVRNFRTDNTVSSSFVQDGFVPSKTRNEGLKLGVDYTASPKTVIGFLVNGISNNLTSTNTNLTKIKNSGGGTDSTINSFSDTRSKFKSYSVNFNFKHTFDTLGRELSIDADYVNYNRSNYAFYQNIYRDNTGTLLHKPDTLLNNYPGTLLIKSFKADYTNPLPGKVKLETGVKASMVSNKNNLEFLNSINGQNVLNTMLSNNFNYDENIYAFYANAGKEFKNVSLQIGVRGEQTHTNSFQVTTNQTVKNNYFQLFPSLFVSYNINADNQLGFTYTRRINRPPYQHLNPYKKIYDPLNYEEGNPYLQPSFDDQVELDYSYKNKVFFSIFFDAENNTSTNIILQDEVTKTTITTFGNLAKSRDGGATISYSDQLLPWFSTNDFIGLFFNHFQGPYLNGYLDVFKPTLNFNLVNTFVLSKTVRAELALNYLSSQQQGLLLIDNIGFQVNPGIQKTIFNKQGNIKFSVTDLLNARTWNYSTRFEQIDTRYLSSRDSRRFTLAFSYRFGKQTVKQERKRITGTDEEKSRAEQ